MSDFWKSLLQNCFIQLKPSYKTQSCVIATYCENASTTSRFYKNIEVPRSYSKDEQKYMIIFCDFTFILISMQKTRNHLFKLCPSHFTRLLCETTVFVKMLCKIEGECKIDYSVISFMKMPIEGLLCAGQSGKQVLMILGQDSFWSQVACSMVWEPV